MINSTIKILHTSDWHLGHHLCDRHRIEEHDLFLQWLLTMIQTHQIDLLIIAGDIFDTGFPPNYALSQYYSFLRQLPDTTCKQAIIIGGNHDAPSTLNAPRDILKYFKIHVIGGAEHNPENEIICIPHEDDPRCIVCAVPFLRARDVKKAISGETYEEKELAIREGIKTHYFNALNLALTLKSDKKIPIIATGHLFASGAKISDSERTIYIGDLDRVGLDCFPNEFDYIALGHLHMPQSVNLKDTIRYSGSPIPLSFSESNHDKSVTIVQFHQDQLTGIDHISIPVFRCLDVITGSVEDVITQIDHYQPDNQTSLFSWIEIKITEPHCNPMIHEKLTSIINNKPIEILKILSNPKPINNQSIQVYHLNDISPYDVFLKKCHATGLKENEIQELSLAFQELLSDMENNSDYYKELSKK